MLKNFKITAFLFILFVINIKLANLKKYESSLSIIKDKSVIESDYAKFLIKQFRTNQKQLCISNCFSITNCHLVSYNLRSKECKYYNSFLIDQSSNLIDSFGTYLYYNIRRKYWPNSNLVKTFLAHTNKISALISLSSGDLASASYDTTIKIWNPEDASLKFNLLDHADYVNCLAELQNGLLASGSDDKLIKIWNLITSECVFNLTHPNFVNSLIVLKNSDLVSGDGDGNIKIWNVSDWSTKIFVLNGHGSYITCFSELSNNHLASGSADDTIKIWNLNNNFSIVRTLTGYTNNIWTLLSLDDDILISGSYNFGLKIWNTSNGVLIKTLENTSYFYCLAMLQNGFVASSSDYGRLIIWDSKDWTINSEINVQDGSNIDYLTVLSNGYLAIATNDYKIQIWN